MGKKGCKMKTHKRFRVTRKDKIMRRCAGKQHLLAKKNTKRKKRLSKMVFFFPPLLCRSNFVQPLILSRRSFQ
ncbi:50S ribosomal protein L35 [Zea mays]|uniref:50S ribosomal protein L35 n=1 Tax=Zea mays TaxID=4577 RepID=A0A1D6JJL9_MAIZE|nr:50S ribosomal protein L35 [Zea mays]